MYIIVISFISVAFVVVKLYIFKCFYGDTASMTWPLLGSFWPFSPKYGLSLLKFRPQVVFHKTKTVSEQSFKIKCLSSNRTYLKTMVLVYFAPNLSQGKPKYCQKPNFSQKLHSYNYQITQVLSPTSIT